MKTLETLEEMRNRLLGEIAENKDRVFLFVAKLVGSPAVDDIFNTIYDTEKSADVYIGEKSIKVEDAYTDVRLSVAPNDVVYRKYFRIP